MFLTRVELNTSKRKTQIALASPSLLHGAIEHSFQEKQERNIWRIDTLNNHMYLLLVSKNKPDMSQFISQFGFDGQSAETKDYSAFLNRIENGTVWRFRLVGNPTHSISSENGRGKVVAHITDKYQLEWLYNRLSSLGMSIVENSCIVKGTEWKMFYKNNADCGRNTKVKILQVAYEGMLKIEDSDAARTGLTEGIGRGKAYGCGLLTLMRC